MMRMYKYKNENNNMGNVAVFSIFSILLFTQIANAGVTVWYDNFERTSISPTWSVIAGNPTLTGGYLLFSDNSTNRIDRSTSGLGLNGDDWTYKINWYWESGGNTGSIFQTQMDTSDGGLLRVKFYPANNIYYIDYYNSTHGYSDLGGTYTLGFSTGAWYQLVILKSDQYINITNYEIGVPSSEQQFIFPNDLKIGGVSNVRESILPNSTLFNIRIDNSLLTSQCFNITSAGTYVFTDDTTIFSGKDCIYIQANDVNLNMNNFSMYGCGNPNVGGIWQEYYGQTSGCGIGSGIIAQNVNNVSILNVANAQGTSKIFGWDVGLSFSNVNGAYVFAMNFANGRVDCNNCQYVQFYGTNFGGNDMSPAFYGNSKYNIVGNAIFYNAYGLGVYWDDDCQYNKMCSIFYQGGQMHSGKPFADYSAEVEGVFTNTYEDFCPSGTPTILFSAPCSGAVGFDCVAGKRFWKDAWCNVVNETQCPYGCAGLTGDCAIPSTSLMNTTPYANISGGLPVELEWLDYLLSPPVLICVVVFGMAGLIASQVGGEKKGLIFLVASLIIFFILTIAGTIPAWIFILLVIAGLAVLFSVFGKQEGVEK